MKAHLVTKLKNRADIRRGRRCKFPLPGWCLPRGSVYYSVCFIHVVSGFLEIYRSRHLAGPYIGETKHFQLLDPKQAEAR